MQESNRLNLLANFIGNKLTAKMEMELRDGNIEKENVSRPNIFSPN